MTPDIKQRLATIQDLIKQGRYDEARALLKLIGHPTAREWLAKLSDFNKYPTQQKLHPLEVLPTFPVQVPQLPYRQPQQRRKHRPIRYLIAILVSVFIVIAVFSQGVRDAENGANFTPTVMQDSDDQVLFSGVSTPSPVQLTPTPEIPTETLAPTQTSIPSPTFTNEELIENLANSILVNSVDSILVNPDIPSIVISYRMPQGLSGYNLNVAEGEMVKLSCALRDIGYANYRHMFAAKIEVIDAFAREFLDDGLVVLLMPEAIQLINCEFPFSVNLQAIADTYNLHRLLQ